MAIGESAILLNDFGALWNEIRSEALDAVDRVGHRGWLILGEEVSAFERDLATFSKVSHCIGVANGLDAIEISLRALGVRCGDKVLTTPLSAFATTLAIIRAGGQPVFVDTDEHGLLDLDAAQRLLEASPDVKYMVPVHLFGHAIDLKNLKKLRDEFSLMIVEDCAQSIGAENHGMAVGSVGQMAATSFYPTKNLGCLGDGGAIFTNDQKLDRAARCLRDYGQSSKYFHDQLGLNSRLDELQAAVLRNSLLPRLTKFIKVRREIANALRIGIKNSKLKIVDEPYGCHSVWHLFPVQVSAGRESFQAHLKSHRILSGIHYPIIIPQQRALEQLACARNSFPNATKLAESEVSLPIHPYLKSEEVERIIAACNSW